MFPLVEHALIRLIGPIPDPETEPAITVSRFTELFGLNEHTVRAAIRRGDIPSVHMSERRILIPTAPLRRKLGLDGVAA